MSEAFYCQTQDLAIGYGKTPLLQNIGIGVQRGQILALIGPNGAGKSTLLKTLAGQLAAQSGAVLLQGQNLTTYTPNARARKMALMLPHTRHTELTTCFDVAAAGRYPYTGRLGILSEEDRMQVRDALHLVQADELADRDFTKISDGQRQRVLLARAVCQQPEIILLDEPTSFLDIKGKIELLTILRQLAQEKQVAVIVSLHELELAQKIADTVVCVSPQGVSGVMTPKDAFAAENIRTLYRLTKEQYEALYGPQPEREPERRPAKQEPPRFEHYIRSGQKLLRCGYTTGTCAALGAAGAARLLLTGKAPESVGLRTPKGIVVEVAPIYCRKTAAGAQCAIRKDGGDDVDVTTGLPVIADITLLPDAPGQVTIDGGPGVGRVTKPGLDQPVGQAAINHVPRRMITDALHAEAEAAGYDGGFDVMISIEGGEEAAKRTFNPHIGVEGGLSVLGTSGIVEPMSQQAVLDTVQLEIHQAALREQSPKRLILAPGNYGLDYLAQNLPEYSSIPVVKCSNFMGDALDMAAAEQFAEVLLVGHIGKLVKLAGGIMNTHSRMADCRTELFCTHAALCGASQTTCRALMDAATTDACLDILDAENLREPVLESLLQAIQLHLDRRVAGAFRVGAVLFSNQAGPLGQTETAAQLLQTADCIIYAGSLVNPALLGLAKAGCAIYNSAEMTLEQVLAVMRQMEAEHKTTVRLHTGDPCLYGAIREQMDALDADGIAYDDTPGVSSFCGAAAALNAEYTLPAVSQTVIITRMEGRTPVPEKEKLASLASHGATMVIFLSIGLIDKVQEALLQGAYTASTPAAVVYKATWPEQKTVRCTVGTLAQSTKQAGITKTALIVVGDFLGRCYARSKLYDPAFTTEYREGTKP